MTETLIGQISRPVTFARHYGPRRIVVEAVAYPTGTEVYVERIRRGILAIRIPGSLLTQQVGLSSVKVP